MIFIKEIPAELSAKQIAGVEEQAATERLHHSDSTASLTQAPIDTASSHESSADNPPRTCMAYEEISHRASGVR